MTAAEFIEEWSREEGREFDAFEQDVNKKLLELSDDLDYNDWCTRWEEIGYALANERGIDFYSLDPENHAQE